jgi:D-alanyl-D-alanine dipeptidase
MNNKILEAGFIRLIIPVVSCFLFSSVASQNPQISTYSLPLINTDTSYNESVLNHPEKKMVSLMRIPGIVMDLRYTTTNNFLHKRLYPENTNNSFLRQPVFRALAEVATDFARRGLILVIFDAYRPYSVTVEIWNPLKDERYAANPAKGSGHNRGVAVDLTLADVKTHRLLPMPTDFDNFSDSARQDFNGTDAKRMANRNLLRHIMEKYGFLPLSTEWWHFSWPHAENYEVLDLSFEELEKNK